MKFPVTSLIALLCALLLPVAAQAHSFGRIYNLPVPFWMYAYGATAALLLSFLVVGFFLNVQSATQHLRAMDLSNATWVRLVRRLRVMTVLKVLSVSLLLLCLLTGFFGNRNPYVNFNMTFFWVVFLLGFAYLTALIGNAYAVINPWRVIAEWIECGVRDFTRGRLPYPKPLAYWPALVLYMAFIWIELFGFNRPHGLAVMLLAYTLINLAGVWLVGKQAWFRYCEFLSVFLRLTAKMAPLDYVPAQEAGGRGRLRLRAPFVGVLDERAENLSLLVFVLFMLSSTAFDGLRLTVPWVTLFWNDPLNLIRPWIGVDPVYAYAKLRPFYLAYESISLLLSPFLYLVIYLLFLALAKWITRSPRGLFELALIFAYTLLPIALVYNITHYYALLLTQGIKILSLISDPFGWGWDLFGTLWKFRAPIMPDMNVVWHSQVGLILLGHIASVYLAHLEALRVFATPRKALLSQIPMLFLMVVFTTFGLWILSQPIQA